MTIFICNFRNKVQINSTVFEKTNLIMEDNELMNSLSEVVKEHQQLVKRALGIYSVKVSVLINSQTKNNEEIQHLLDGLLDFFFDDDFLLLFKKVCRYYYPINPQITVNYVYIYRDLWDENCQVEYNTKN